MKTPGIDNITAELLKNGGNALVDRLLLLCQNIWCFEQIPVNWKKGIIVTIGKKGDMTLCKNYRGITLLSIMGKVFVFSIIIMNRMNSSVDNVLREQFIEKSLEFQVLLCQLC